MVGKPQQQQKQQLCLSWLRHNKQSCISNSFLRRYCNKDSVNTIGYALLEQLDEMEKSFWEKQNQGDRVNMGIMTQAEASALIKETIKTLPPLFQVSCL